MFLVHPKSKDKVWKEEFRFGSYPTYEEWKLAEPVSGEIRSSRSYPTYEEWKPSHIDLGIRKRTVLILPMRNGNNLMTEIY